MRRNPYRKSIWLFLLTTPSLLLLSCAHTPAGGEHSKTGTLRGRIVDERSKGIENARVAVAGISEEHLTHPDGSFLFAKVHPGTYTVIAKATDYDSGRREGVRVEEGRVTEVEMALSELPIRMLHSPTTDPRESPDRPTGTIQGNVSDESGHGLQYASVFAINDAHQHGALTEREGHFVLSGVPIGTYEVRVRMVGFAYKYREHVSVSEGDTTRVDFRLKAVEVKMGH